MSLPDRNVFDHLQVTVFVLDVLEDGDFAFALINRFGAAATGLDQSTLEGRRPEELFPRRVAQRMRDKYRSAIAARVPITYDELYALKGGEMWWRTTLTPEIAPDREIRRLFGVSFDITAEKRAEQERLEAIAALQDGKAAAERFVSIAAHDLRAPLRQIDQVAHELRDGLGATSPFDVELLDLLDRVVARTRRLIDDVLDYAEAARMGGEIRRFDLARLVNEIAGVLDPNAASIIRAAPRTVEAEQVVVEIALRNFLDNALRHSGASEVRIEVTARNAPHGMLRIAVMDNGRGLEAPDRVFDIGRSERGSGFGLRAVLRLARARGGDVEARNRSEGGAEFAVILPGRVAAA